MDNYRRILDFWFGELEPQQWWQASDELDQLIKAEHQVDINSYEMSYEVCRTTANNYSSMLQDFQHNKPSEISDSTNGRALGRFVWGLTAVSIVIAGISFVSTRSS